MRTIKIKRVYERPEDGDGVRILVDRMWPRGLTKKKANIDYWMKEIAPSEGLRKWFSHRDSRWVDFRRRYKTELKSKKGLIGELRGIANKSSVILLFAAKNQGKNNAVVLKEYLEVK